MVSPEVKIMLNTCLDIKIDYASTAVRFSVRMDQIPIMLSEFIRVVSG